MIQEMLVCHWCEITAVTQQPHSDLVSELMVMLLY